MTTFEAAHLPEEQRERPLPRERRAQPVERVEAGEPRAAARGRGVACHEEVLRPRRRALTSCVLRASVSVNSASDGSIAIRDVSTCWER